MKPHVRRRVARFLQWMVQHEHHYAGWLSRSDTDPPEKWYGFELRGHRKRITVARSTKDAARDFYGPAPEGKYPTRMFYPNAAGFALIREELSL